MKKKSHGRAAVKPDHESAKPISPSTDPFNRIWLALAVMLALDIVFFNRALLPNCMIYGSDFLSGGYMSRAFLIDQLRRFGTIPMWEPFLYGGVPYVDAVAGDLFYPVSWITRWMLPPHMVVGFSYFLHFLVAGAGTYLFLRRYRFSGTAAFLAGVAYMFTGSMVSLMFAGHDGKIIVSALLPWFLLSLDLMVTTERLLWTMVAGLVLGFALLSPHVQMTYYLLLAGLGFAAAKLYQQFLQHRSWLRTAKTLGLGLGLLVVGFGLFAIQALPLQSYIKFSPRGQDKGYAFATSYSMPPEEVINTAWPEFSGLIDKDADQPTHWYWGRRDLKLHTEYIGVITLLLVAIGLAYSRRKRLKLFFCALGLFALVVAFGGFTPLYHLVYYIPGMAKFRSPSMIFNIVAFTASGLSALGVQALIDGDKTRKLGMHLLVAAGCGLLLGVVFSVAKESLVGLLDTFAARGWGRNTLWENYPEMVKGYWIAYVLFVLGCLLAGLLATRKMPLRWWAIVCGLLMFLELWRVDVKFLKIVESPGRYFPKDDIVTILQQDTSRYRVWPLQYQQQPNYLMLWGIEQVGGEHGNQLRRYNEYVGTDPQRLMPDFQNLQRYPSFIDLLNVKYLISYTLPTDTLPYDTRGRAMIRGMRWLFSRYTPAYQNGQYTIYRNDHALPRTWLVGSYEVAANDEQILTRMQRPDFDPAATVILEQSPRGFSPQPKLVGTAVITNYTPNHVSISVNASAPALLVMSDNHFPAWKAFVDGQPAECYRADYTFRAVVVPAGSHKVEFKYQSGVYDTGKTISLVSLILTLAGIAGLSAVELIKRKKSEPETPEPA